uniref:Peptidase A2 domain-containing protein n=1 Tax=Bracon brevicornis TaxID=1563983 RepID=A0A6V7L7D7_9HYME
MHLFGEPRREALVAMTDSLLPSCRLFLRHINTQEHYLIDGGSDLSLFPPRGKAKATGYQLYAANGTTIDTYGQLSVNPNLGLHRDMTWQFVLADVSQPIIGVEFLYHFNLLTDERNGCLIDGTTGLSSNGGIVRLPHPTVKTVDSHPELAISRSVPRVP